MSARRKPRPCWLRHDWRVIERIGRVVTYRCENCSKEKTRVK